MFRALKRVVRARFSSLPAPVVPGLGKVVKILPKHFSTILPKTITIAPQTMWVCFRSKTKSPGPGFQLYLLKWGSWPKKSSKLDENNFQLHWWQTIRTPQTVWVCYRCKTGSTGQVINLAFFGPALMVPWPGKVVEIGPKHSLAVLMGNDKNCTPKKCRYVSGAKPSNLGPIFKLSCSGGARTRKVVKT